MASSAAYFDPHLLAKIHGLSLRAKHVVDGYLAGAHRSTHHGYSVEFRQHRPYAPGDDPRHVDWKIFGRTDKLYVKQFEDETNLVAMLMLDGSRSMAYRSELSPLSKFDYAACLLTALAWLLQQQGDAVGISTFADSLQQTLEPNCADDQVDRLVRLVEQTKPSGKTSVAVAMRQLAHQLTRSGLVILASDLLDDRQSLLSGLAEIQQRKQQVIVFQICDPDEIEFPFQGQTRFSDMEGSARISIDPALLRCRYRQLFEDFSRELRAVCRQQAIDLIQVQTRQPLDQVLTAFLATGQRDWQRRVSTR